MPHSLSVPVASLMTSPVVVVGETAPLAEVDRILRDRNVSCLAVTGPDGRPSGVISRTDLLRLGRVEAHLGGPPGAAPRRSRGRAALLSLPDRPVREAMRVGIVSVGPDSPLSAACRVMVGRRIHRVFVMSEGALVGVVSTKDVLLAIDMSKMMTPIHEIMSTPAYTVPATAALSLATDRLERAHVTGLCVVDEDEWPVGTFTQAEALASREVDGDTPVEEVMSYAMLCLPARTPVYRAAASAHATRARRVLAVEGGRVQGVITGLDFARFAASA